MLGERMLFVGELIWVKVPFSWVTLFWVVKGGKKF